jgi:LacI family transcriptional regulator
MATEDETVRLVLDRLRADPWARPDLAALAATACVSRSTLEHRFQAVVGRSIHEAFVRQRVAGVRRLVAETNLPLKAIASRTGFKSVQYMTTFLHRHAGLTPARLRSLERAASRLTGSLEDRSSKAPDDLAAKADAPAALPEKT